MIIIVSIVSLFTIFLVAYLAFQQRKKKFPKTTVQKFLGIRRTLFTTESGRQFMLVGIAGGIISGFISNMGVWFGFNLFEPWLRKRGWSRIVSFGAGNALSSVITTLVVSFTTVLIADTYNKELGGTPIWSTALGTVIGSLIGIFASKGLAFYTSKSI